MKKKITLLYTHSLNTSLSFLVLLLLLLSNNILFAQCPTGSTEVTVTYTAGIFDEENSWVLWDATNNVSLACYEELQQGANTQTACVPDGAQIELITYESFGDGWNNSAISVAVSEDGTGGSTCTNNPAIFSNLSPVNGQGSPNNPGSVPQGAITSCPPASIPADVACQNTFSIDNTCNVTGNISTSIIGPSAPLCVNEPFLLTGGTVNSAWSGQWITDNMDGTATFNAGFPGTYPILHADGAGCSTATIIEVLGIFPTIEGNFQLCLSSAPNILGPADPSVSWSGPGIISNADGTAIFDPSVAGVGPHTVTFNYSNPANGCNYTIDYTFTVSDSDPPDPGTYGPVCASGGTITLTGTPANGNWFGAGIIMDNGDGTAIFDPSQFGGSGSVTVFYEVNGSCVSETEIEIIGGDPFVPNYGSQCIDGFDFTLFADPAGGVWTGTGIVNNGDGTYDFSPSTAGIGTYTLTYTYQEPTNTCPPSVVTTDITVIANTLDPGTYGPLCGSDAPITLMGNPVDPGGIWFGPGVTNLNDGTATFDPSTVGSGTISVGYSLNGCNQFTEILVEGGTPFIFFDPNITQLCSSQDPIQLFGSPFGGTWTGMGVTDDGNGTVTFDPATTGAGIFTVFYTVSDGSNCPSATQTVDFTVSDGTPPDPGTYGPICVNDAPFTLIGTPGGGTWSGFAPGQVVVTNPDGTGTFNPQNLPVGIGGASVNVVYTQGGCSSEIFIDIIGIFPEINGSLQLCAASDPVTLGPADPSVSWSGPGVTNNADGTATFDPSITGAGNHAVIFSYSNAENGCAYTVDYFFDVSADDPPDIGSYGPLCSSGGTITLSGTPTNGFWFGAGVTDNGDGTATFDPSVFGNATATVLYEINGTCRAQTEIEIIDPTPFVSNYEPQCVDRFDFTLFANPAGGVWTGTGIVDNGDGTYNFSPSTAGIGTHPLTYTYQEPTNTCPASVITTDITVVSNDIDLGTYGPVCGADSPITLMTNPSDLGGFWFGPGVTNLNDGTATFDPSNVGSGAVGVGYFLNGCDVFTEILVEGGTPFINFFPNVTEFCNSSEPVQLFGFPSGGIWAGTAIIDNGDGTAIFDPTAAGLGTFTVSYTVSDESDCPPATQMVDFTVNSGTPPDPGTYGPICFEDGPITLIGSPNDGTGTWSGFAEGFVVVNNLDAAGNPDGTGTFFPERLPVGVGGESFNVIYTHGGCSSLTTITVNGGPIHIDDSLTEVCLSDEPFPLFTHPTNGTWSGSAGITTNMDERGNTFFDPALAGVGTHTITYNSEETGCEPVSASRVIEVSPSAMTGTYSSLCADAAPIILTGIPTDANGEWTGVGVTDNGDGTAIFDPAMASIGENMVTYIYPNDNCTDVDATTIIVNDCMIGLEVSDPCSCTNPDNIRAANGSTILFQDVLRAETSPGLTVLLESNDGNLLNNNGVPLPIGLPFIESAPGMYELNFFTRPNQPATVTITNGLSTTTFVTDSCMCDDLIPTLSQWGLIIYGLVLLNLGLIFIRRKDFIEA